MIHRRLAALDKRGTPIRVGIVGCGRMGMGVINSVTAGVAVAALDLFDLMRFN